MMCSRYERWMWDELEGRLSATQSQALRAHLQACARCQRRWEAAQATYQALRTLPRHRAPQNVAQQVRARIQHTPARQPAVAWWKRAALAPALGLMLALAWWGWLSVRTGSQTASQSPTAYSDTENWVELHEQLEVADWSPTPTANYFITAGYTR